MQLDFLSFIKKHWIITLTLIIIPIIFSLLLFQSGLNLIDSDSISFIGSLLTYIGTILLSAVALYQSEKADQLSQKVLSLNERAYHTVFAIESINDVTIKDCNYYDDPEHSRIIIDRIGFCDVDSTPHQCKGFQLGLKNCGNYPIKHISVSTTYPIGREKQKETLKKDKDILVQSGESHYFLFCNAPIFHPDVSGVKFIISCRNIYDYCSTMELEIESIKEQDKKETLKYSCKFLTLNQGIPDIKKVTNKLK